MKKVWEAAGDLRAAGRRQQEASTSQDQDRPAAGDGSRSREAAAAVPTKSWAVPPVGNTGGKLTTGLTVKLDWLNVTFPTGRRDEVIAAVARFLGEPEHVTWGRHTYREHFAWATSAALYFTEGRPEALLSLNADSIDCIPLNRQRAFLGELAELGGKGTKIDIAVDDYERRVAVEDIDREYQAGHVVGFRLGNRQNPRRWVGRALEAVGDSITLGRRGTNGSGKSLIVYDKNLESRGAINSIRWELRLSADRAETAFECLSSSLSDSSLARKLTQYVGGCVDFRTEPDETHVDRRPRVGWWQALLDVLEAATIVVHRTIPPLQKSLLYLRDAWAKKLALARVIVDGLGGDFFGMLAAWADEGEEKIDWNRAGGLDLELNLSAVGSPCGIPI